ncbi:hypothetical protein MCGE09_00281 [Thaumarchaeota archaeon SCGC AB-539-E09]|nr:hypothetical protein MCGE09_00281 [Thaumarchaeota archaeon SCGC AB-539-E09]
MTEFKCEACGEVFEKPPNRVCPKCGEDRKMVMYRLWKLKQGNK